MARELEADKKAVERVATAMGGLANKKGIKTVGAPPVYLVW